MQLFFPFREKLATYRGYRIIGNDSLGQIHRSLILSKNRYGIANQVINLGFWGSVGWWNELPAPDQITDYSRYQTEFGNIPCKLNQNLIKDSSTPQRVENKKPLTFSF